MGSDRDSHAKKGEDCHAVWASIRPCSIIAFDPFFAYFRHVMILYSLYPFAIAYIIKVNRPCHIVGEIDNGIIYGKKGSKSRNHFIRKQGGWAKHG
jgi:hypothetical protein